MKLETPKDIFLYLSKFLHLYGRKYNAYFIYWAITDLYRKNKIDEILREKTLILLRKYLSAYGHKFGANYSPKFMQYVFNLSEIKQRKAFLNYIYKIETKHENNLVRKWK